VIEIEKKTLNIKLIKLIMIPPFFSSLRAVRTMLFVRSVVAISRGITFAVT